MTELIDVVIVGRTDEADGVIAVELARSDGEPLPAAPAGSHVDVHLRSTSLVRQYSLCGDPGCRDSYRIGVLREPDSRGGSVALHEEAVAGAALQISTPRNQFALPAEADHVVLIAGGIGITPLLAMAYELHESGIAFELHHRAGGREKAGFVAELEAGPLAGATHWHYNTAAFEPKAVLGASEDRRHAMICGPIGFMDKVCAAARELGWVEDHLHTERFTQPALNEGEERTFAVEARRSGRTFEIPPDRTILDVLLENGMEVETSCEVGICGTCITGVLEGTPDHRDEVLDADEKAANDQITVCCSRSLTDTLVLDL